MSSTTEVCVEASGQRRRAWELAGHFALPTVYDAAYLALADLRGCEFWTADERLFRRVENRLTFVRWLGDYSWCRWIGRFSNDEMKAPNSMDW